MMGRPNNFDSTEFMGRATGLHCVLFLLFAGVVSMEK